MFRSWRLTLELMARDLRTAVICCAMSVVPHFTAWTGPQASPDFQTGAGLQHSVVEDWVAELSSNAPQSDFQRLLFHYCVCCAVSEDNPDLLRRLFELTSVPSTDRESMLWYVAVRGRSHALALLNANADLTDPGLRRVATNRRAEIEEMPSEVMSGLPPFEALRLAATALQNGHRHTGNILVKQATGDDVPLDRLPPDGLLSSELIEALALAGQLESSRHVMEGLHRAAPDDLHSTTVEVFAEQQIIYGSPFVARSAVDRFLHSDIQQYSTHKAVVEAAREKGLFGSALLYVAREDKSLTGALDVFDEWAAEIGMPGSSRSTLRHSRRIYLTAIAATRKSAADDEAARCDDLETIMETVTTAEIADSADARNLVDSCLMLLGPVLQCGDDQVIDRLLRQFRRAWSEESPSHYFSMRLGQPTRDVWKLLTAGRVCMDNAAYGRAAELHKEAMVIVERDEWCRWYCIHSVASNGDDATLAGLIPQATRSQQLYLATCLGYVDVVRAKEPGNSDSFLKTMIKHATDASMAHAMQLCYSVGRRVAISGEPLPEPSKVLKVF